MAELLDHDLQARFIDVADRGQSTLFPNAWKGGSDR